MSYVNALKHWLYVGKPNGMTCNREGIYHDGVMIHKWKGWLSHPIYNTRCLHFLSAITRKNLDKINGFDNRFAHGLNYDDDDFLCKISNNVKEVRLLGSSAYGIHQYHTQVKQPSLEKALHSRCKLNRCECLNCNKQARRLRVSK